MSGRPTSHLQQMPNKARLKATEWKLSTNSHLRQLHMSNQSRFTISNHLHLQTIVLEEIMVVLCLWFGCGQEVHKEVKSCWFLHDRNLHGLGSLYQSKNERTVNRDTPCACIEPMENLWFRLPGSRYWIMLSHRLEKCADSRKEQLLIRCLIVYSINPAGLILQHLQYTLLFVCREYRICKRHKAVN